MKNFSQFFQRNDALSRLRLTARQLTALTREIRAALPTESGSHIVGCAPRPGALVILTDSAAWASQLRYAQADILAICRRKLDADIRRVHFKVLPPEPAAPESPAVEISDSSRDLLKRSATGIADDELAAALRRLSRRDDQDAD